MTDILQPSYEHTAELLGGYPDSTEGKEVTAYFSSLNENDREIVQWYLEMGISPDDTAGYVYELIAGYHLRDPERKNVSEKEAALREVSRIERFLGLYQLAETVFPEMMVDQEDVYDDQTDTVDTINFTVWSAEYMDLMPLRQQAVLSSILPTIELGKRVLLDPTIYSEYAEAKQYNDFLY